MARPSHTFDKDQPSELPGGRARQQPEPPRFDEGEPRPSPIERTGDDNVRSSTPGPPARRKRKADPRAATDATMPPGEGRDPKRNTL